MKARKPLPPRPIVAAGRPIPPDFLHVTGGLRAAGLFASTAPLWAAEQAAAFASAARGLRLLVPLSRHYSSR